MEWNQGTFTITIVGQKRIVFTATVAKLFPDLYFNYFYSKSMKNVEDRYHYQLFDKTWFIA